MGEVERGYKILIPKWLADELDIPIDNDEGYVVVEFAGWEYLGEATESEEEIGG